MLDHIRRSALSSVDADKLKTGDKVRFKVINDGGRFMLTEIQPAK